MGNSSGKQSIGQKISRIVTPRSVSKVENIGSGDVPLASPPKERQELCSKQSAKGKQPGDTLPNAIQAKEKTVKKIVSDCHSPSEQSISVKKTDSVKRKHRSRSKPCKKLNIISAAKQGNIEGLVNLVLVDKEDINKCGMWNSTPLLYACQYGHGDAAEFLIEHGADVVAQNERHATPLLLASLEGLTSVVKLLLGSCKCGQDEISKESCLLMSSLTPGQVYCSYTDKNMLLSPMLAACIGGHVQIVRALTEHGSLVHAGVPILGHELEKSSEGENSKLYPFSECIVQGHTAVVEYLLDSYYLVNFDRLTEMLRVTYNNNSSTNTFHQVLAERHEETASLLIKKVLLKRKEYSHDQEEELLRYLLYERSHEGMRVLDLACRIGFSAIVCLLVDLVDCNDRSSFLCSKNEIDRGNTCLHYACEGKFENIAICLLESCPSVYQQMNYDRISPEIVATSKELSRVIQATSLKKESNLEPNLTAQGLKKSSTRSGEIVGEGEDDRTLESNISTATILPKAQKLPPLEHTT